MPLSSFDCSLLFFCKRGQSGLTSVVDIIRTFGHNFSHGSSKIRSALQSLKDSGFQIEENIGVYLLFQKLLAALSEMAIFIILDGLDEFDITIQDKVGSEAQIHILLRALTTLPNTKIIFTSR